MQSNQLNSLIAKYLELQEVKRKELWTKFKKKLIYTFLTVVVISFLFFQIFDANWSVFFGFAGVIYLIFIIVSKLNKYKSEYIKSFIRPLMKHQYPWLTYEPKKYVSKEIFDKSELFPTDSPMYRGEDYFHGKYKNTTIGFSEVSASRNSNKDGSKRKKGTSGFYMHGLFFYMTWDQKKDYKFYARNMNSEESVHPMNSLKCPFESKTTIKTGNPNVDTQFKFWVEPDSMGQLELPNDFFNKIIALNETLSKLSPLQDIRISAYPTTICVALQPLRIFEPPIFKKSTEHQKTLEQNLLIIEILTTLNVSKI